jgi:PAS domain S-box-containing protein
MRERGNHLRPILDAMPLLLWAAGPDRRCAFFNKRWLEFVGRTSEEQLGREWIENVHPEDRPRCSSIYARAFARREEFQFECRLRRADGDYRWVIANGAPRLTPAGTFAGFAGAFTDVHELGLSTAEGEAGARRLSSIGTLAAGIAHDFNNLLANILANAELALTEVPSRSRAIEELERIRMVAIRGAEIVRELMVYAGQEQATAEAVDLSRLVEEMMEMLRISVTKHARITVQLAPNLPPVMAAPAEIRELLMNLILNASEALGERDGEIRISTSYAKGRAERVDRTTGASGDCVRLVVADTGPGIPASMRNRIFDPFVTTKHPGRGVGLAIVRTIARKYGGSIRITSAPGRGTRFSVMLPCAAGQAESEGVARSVSTSLAGTGRTVLIVEDEDGLRLAIAVLLRRNGFQVIEAQDGSAAVELLRTHSQAIDTILLDLTIPGVSSEDVIEEARRLRSDVRIFLTSAYSRGNGAPPFNAPQVRGFVRKPYQIRELVRLLSEETYVYSTSGNTDGH